MALWTSRALKYLKYHRTGRSNKRSGGCAAKKSPFLPKRAEQAKKGQKVVLGLRRYDCDRKRFQSKPGRGPAISTSTCSKTATRQPSLYISQHGKHRLLHGKRSNIHLMSAMFTSNGFISRSWAGFKFRNESPEDGSSALIATSDSSLRSAPAILFSCPRGQPCLCCCLVSPPRWREASLPVAVPVSGSALGCFCACARDAISFGDVAT